MGSDIFALNAEFSNLHNLKLNVKKGSVTCIAGPVNTGKTTIVNMLADVIKYEDGFVGFDGGNWENDEVEIKRKVSFVYTFTNFNSYATPRRIANDLMALEPIFDYEYFMDKMELLDFDMNQKISKYSYDRRVLLKIIIAIARRPEMLILDEPFDSLEFRYRHMLLLFLEEFMREGNHTILFTHDTSFEDLHNDIELTDYNDFNCELKAFCDEIIMMNTGEVILNENKCEEVNFIQNDVDNVNIIKKQNIFKRWYRIANFYFGDGTNNARIDMMKYLVLIVILTIFFDINMHSLYYYGVFFFIYLIITGIFNIAKTFRVKTSLIYNLAISRRKQVINSYLVVGMFCLLFLFIAGIVKYIYESNINTVTSSSSYEEILLYTFLFMNMLLIYFPLAFIQRLHIWWIYSIGATALFYAIYYIVINSMSVQYLFHMGTNIDENRMTLINFPWYMFGFTILSIAICICSIKVSNYFFTKERYYHNH